MAGLDDKRRADFAGVDDPLHLGVAPVIAAHEAHLYQAAAQLQLPADDVLAVLGVLAQGLLAEAPLLLSQGLHHIVMMGGIDGGDDHRLHLGVTDHAVTVVAVGTDAVFRGGVVGSGGHIVGHGHNGGPGDGVHDPAAMVPSNGPAADNSDFQNLFHGEFLLIVIQSDAA